MVVPSDLLSPLGLQFLAVLNRFRKEMITAQQFVAAVSERQKAMEMYRNQVLPNLPIVERPGAGDRQRNAVRILHDAACDMASLIPLLLQYAQSREVGLYQSLVERLGRMASAERVAIDMYHQGNVPEGPTDMPFVNAVYYDLERFYAGKISKVACVNTINRIIDKLEEASQEIDERTHYDANAKASLLYAYEKFQEALRRVREAIPEGESSTKTLMREVVNCAEQVRDSIKIYTFHANTNGPTKMVQANLMINMCQAWQEGRLEASVFLRALEIFQANLDKTWRQVQAMASLPNDSDEITPILEPLQNAYVMQFQAVEHYRRGVNGDASALDEALRLISEGANAAADCKAAFDAMGDKLGKVPCMRCGALNEAGNRTCTKCGARIIADMDMDAQSSTLSYSEQGGKVQMEGGELKVTPQLKKLFDAANAMAEGTVSAEEFVAAIDSYQDYLLRAFDIQKVNENLLRAGEIGEQDDASDLPQRVDALCDDLHGVLQGIVDSLNVLRQYAYNVDSRYLFEGSRTLRDYSIKLQGVVSQIQAIIDGSAAVAARQAAAESGVVGFDITDTLSDFTA